MKRAIGIIAMLAASSLPAQDPATAEVKPKAAFRVLFNFDFRRTYVNADPVRFYGFRLAAQRENDVIGIGFYGLGDPYVQDDVALPSLGQRTVRTDFDFTAFTYERLLVNSKRWQIGAPVSVGLGNYRRGYVADDGMLVPMSTNELVPIEASLHVDYNILWWVFIGVGGGYRHVLAADPAATRTLSDWTYYLKAGLRLGEVVKRVRGNGKSSKDGTQGS